MQPADSTEVDDLSIDSIVVWTDHDDHGYDDAWNLIDSTAIAVNLLESRQRALAATLSGLAWQLVGLDFEQDQSDTATLKE